MNAIAHALAHGAATATRATSDIAKTREGTTPHNTTREVAVAKSASWRLVTVGARDRDAMMTLTHDLAAPDLTTIEHLDWDHKPTCEVGPRDNPCGAQAGLLVGFWCNPGCDGYEQSFACLDCWNVLGRNRVKCGDCLTSHLRDEVCTLLAVL